MPRIYDAASNPWDFCRDCLPSEAEALTVLGDNGRENNQGPDGRGNCFGYDAEHPDYDGEDYRCDRCRRHLTAKDN